MHKTAHEDLVCCGIFQRSFTCRL